MNEDIRNHEIMDNELEQVSGGNFTNELEQVSGGNFTNELEQVSGGKLTVVPL